MQDWKGTGGGLWPVLFFLGAIFRWRFQLPLLAPCCQFAVVSSQLLARDRHVRSLSALPRHTAYFLFFHSQGARARWLR
jgi:hypothetical protein